MGDRERARPQVLLLGRGIRGDWTRIENQLYVRNTIQNEDRRGTDWLYPVPDLSWLFGNADGPLPVCWVI